MGYLRLFFICVFVIPLSWGQITFYKSYSDNGGDFGHGIVQLEDSSYVVTGSSSSFVNGAQAFLLKIDSLGNRIWSNHYGGSEIESGRRVLYTKNFGFLVAGFTNSMGNGGFDFYLFKTDEAGNLIWERTYGNTGWEKVHDAALTADTGVIMVGETSSTENDNLDAYIVRTNKDGDTLWTRQFGDGGDDYISAIRRYDDTTYVIAGRMYVEDSSYTKAYLSYIHENGTVYWETLLMNPENHWYNDLDFEGGRIISVGGASGPTHDGIDLLFNHCLMDGSPLGASIIPNPGSHENTLMTTYGPSNNFYIAYYAEDNWSFPGGVDIHVSKYLTNFAWQNSFSVGHIDPDIAGQLIRTSDGGAILTGYTTGVVSGGNEVFVAKIGPNDVYPNYTQNVTDELVAIEEEEIHSGVLVYPNPATDIVQIIAESLEYNEVKLVNTSGQIVGEFELVHQLTIDISKYPKGYYFVEVNGSNELPLYKKIVIH